MASQLPTGALSNLANSVKSIVTSQVEVEEPSTGPAAVAEVDKTVETHHDGTTEHKEKAAPVVHEEVKAHEHEKVDTVVDKDVHQDHYHTTIQPVKDKNVRPTKHVYQENKAEREIDHRNDAAKKKAEEELASIQNEKKVHGTTHSKDVAPTQEDEHIHHHYHETVQPVIERETLQEKVVHTTNHVHETEHLNDEHHEATVAPAITIDDFETGTGAKTGASATKAVTTKEKPETKTASVAKKVSTSDLADGHTKATVGSKKRDAPSEDVDINEVTKVGKPDGAAASNPLKQ